MRTLLATALIQLACGTASAGVVYNWHTLDAKGATSTISGQVVVDDAAWLAAGGMVPAYSFTPTDCTMNPSACAPGEERGDPSSPILLFDFHVNGESGGWAWHLPRTGNGFEDRQTFFVTDGLGTVFSGGTFAAVTINGGEIIELWAEDRGGNCWRDVCAGVLGEWVLDEATVPARIPVPGTSSLLAAGLAVLTLARRRRT